MGEGLTSLNKNNRMKVSGVSAISTLLRLRELVQRLTLKFN